MATRRQKIQLGVFILSTAVLVVAAVVIFAGVRFWERETEYLVEVSGSVMGLESGSEVRLNGVKVGSVDEVVISPEDISKVRITLAVVEGTPIRTDTRAMLVMRGITGLKVVDLRGGTAAAAPLPPGSTIPLEEGPLERLAERADQIAERTLEVMDSADRALATTTRVGEQLELMVAENRALVKGALSSVSGAARSASRLMDGELKQMVAGTREMVSGASSLVEDMSGVVRQNQGQLRAALTDLRRASGNFKELSRDLRRRPSSILFSRPPADRKLP